MDALAPIHSTYHHPQQPKNGNATLLAGVHPIPKKNRTKKHPEAISFQQDPFIP